MGYAHSAPLCAYFTFLIFFVCQASARFTFDECEAKAEGIYNGSLQNNLTFNPLYLGIPHGLSDLSILENNTAKNVAPYVLLTRDGCKALCGPWPELNRADEAFQILTTWVLPIIALFSNLPFESLSKKKTRHTFEALVNWIGSPQSAFTTTMFNIYQIRNCKQHIRSGNLRQRYTDSFFVLSCINQYYYARYSTKRKMKPDHAKELEDLRNTALFYGLFRPLSAAADGFSPATDGDVKETSFLLANLAYQLRILRRRGVYPMTLNIIWFFLSFIVSLVLAFANLGDNTTAHSLALGLGLTWLPALVFMTIVDRNPVSPTRCKVLIERWLYNVNAVIEFNKEVTEIDKIDQGNGGTPIASRTLAIRWWNHKSFCELTVDDFVGQGRRMRHCGVTSTVLERLDHPSRPRYVAGTVHFTLAKIGYVQSALASGWSTKVSSDSAHPSIALTSNNEPRESEDDIETAPLQPHTPLITSAFLPKSQIMLERGDERRVRFHHDDPFALYEFLAAGFEEDLVKRPISWWICWVFGGVFVSTSVFMAIMVSFNTPTIGLGCRSLTWLVFWLLSSMSWFFQAIFQEPPRLVRWVSVFFNTVAFFMLLVIMMAQTMNAFNNCTCRAAVFGSTSVLGGYMDFMTAQFYKDNYHVITWWAVGSAIGPLGGILPICWTLLRWSRSSELWKVDEDPEHPIEHLERPGPDDVRKWDGDPLMWLT